MKDKLILIRNVKIQLKKIILILLQMLCAKIYSQEFIKSIIIFNK